MTDRKERSAGYIVFAIGPSDRVRIGEVVYAIDLDEPALVAPDGQRLSLADDAVVEPVPGLTAQRTVASTLGPLAIQFGGRGDVPIIRLRDG